MVRFGQPQSDDIARCKDNLSLNLSSIHINAVQGLQVDDRVFTVPAWNRFKPGMLTGDGRPGNNDVATTATPTDHQGHSLEGKFPPGDCSIQGNQVGRWLGGHEFVHLSCRIFPIPLPGYTQ